MSYWYIATFLLFFICKSEGRVSTNANDTYGGVLLEKDKVLELQCNITVQNDEEQKEFQIKWVKDSITLNDDKSEEFIIENANFTLKVDKPIEGKHTGHYMCIFSRGEESYNASIFVQNKAHVTQFARSVNLVQGDTLPLKCFFGGVPTPTIRWYKDDQPLNQTDPRMNISQGEEVGKPIVKKYSLLKITDLDYDDKGTYKCEADNGLSEEAAFTTITVRVKDKLAALWPFLGICAEVAILCTIIFVYEKKRVKPDFDENEGEPNTDNKNVLDQKEGAQDVRQRK